MVGMAVLKSGEINMEEKMISVIIPVYNAEKYLEECLDSIVNQTIGIEHIELIVVDDGSTDHSLQCLMKYEQKYPDSILLVPLEENGGQANARNIGIYYANAPYLTFVDADDWVDTDAYEKMLDPVNRYQCDMLQCGVTVHVGDAIHYMDMEPGYFEIKNQKERNKFFDTYKSVRMIGNTLYRTEWVKKHGFEFKNFAKYEDNYWAGIVPYFVGSCYAMSDHLYHYRIRESSNSQVRNDEGHFERLRVELEKLKFYQENGLFDIYYEGIREQFLKVFYCNTLHIIFCKFDNIPLERIRDMQSIVKEIFPDYLDYCKKSELFVNQVLTVAFDFPLDVWEDYKEAYLDWVEERQRGKLALYYAKMRKALNLP